MLNKSATAVFRKLTADLNPGDSRKIDNTDGTFMPVHVECLRAGVYSIAHYFTQHGDLCADPDMVFEIHGDDVLPVEFSQAIPPVFHDARDSVAAQKKLAAFANQWMANIADQQRL